MSFQHWGRDVQTALDSHDLGSEPFLKGSVSLRPSVAVGVGVYQDLASVLLSINWEVALPFLPLPRYSLVT